MAPRRASKRLRIPRSCIRWVYTQRWEVPRVEAPSVERKLAAIFAADVEGYSRLMGRRAMCCGSAGRHNQGERGEPADEQMRFRIGIHVGDIVVQGDNLFGDAVNIAARLEAFA